MQVALITHIVSGVPLPRDNETTRLVSADVWSFETKGLLPILPWTDVGTISDYLCGRAPSDRLMSYLLGALDEDNDYPLTRAADFLLKAKLGPWSSVMQFWEDPLIGKDSLVQKDMLQELKDSQEVTNGPRDLWLWACIIESVCIQHDEVMMYRAWPLMEELELDIPPAFLFWERVRWEQHPRFRLPSMPEMIELIEACEKQQDFM